MPIPKQPLAFAIPSLINDTTKTRAKLEQDFKDIVREADRHFGPDKVDQLVHDTRKGRQGNTPDEERNALILSKWDAARARGLKKNRFAREYAKEHGEKFDAVRRQLNRLLDTREQQTKEKARRDAEKARRDAWERRFQGALRRSGFDKSLLGAGTK